MGNLLYLYYQHNGTIIPCAALPQYSAHCSPRIRDKLSVFSRAVQVSILPASDLYCIKAHIWLEAFTHHNFIRSHIVSPHSTGSHSYCLHHNDWKWKRIKRDCQSCKSFTPTHSHHCDWCTAEMSKDCVNTNLILPGCIFNAVRESR